MIRALHELRVRVDPRPAQKELDAVADALTAGRFYRIQVSPDGAVVERESALAVLLLASRGITEWAVETVADPRRGAEPLPAVPPGAWDVPLFAPESVLSGSAESR